MTERMPRDFTLAKRAYEAWFGDNTQVTFEALAHDYQMRWVDTIRKVMLEVQRLKRNEPADLSETELSALSELRKARPKVVGAILESEWSDFQPSPQANGKKTRKPRKGKKRTWTRVVWKTAPLKKWKELTPAERNARQRESVERNRTKN